MNCDYRLYLVTDSSLDDDALCRVVRQAVAGGVTMVQLREKQGDIRAFIRRAQKLKTLLCGSGVPLIINDRLDVALAVDADGLHLGQSDMPAQLARRLLGQDKILGLTVESMAQLHEAQTLPVDYLGISTVFATATKTDTRFEWGLDGLSLAVNCSSKPLVAIGGIGEANFVRVRQTGVAGIALVSAICAAAQPSQASRRFRQMWLTD
ncbi:thiamine phosphate synthase [Shewanella sp. GXUN23E]|uniref:thiamine phosphate synthase n=1 Tax=Shewanella sp. GXUN23E TaxID=3422498 RepID=UPI003D7C7E53